MTFTYRVCHSIARLIGRVFYRYEVVYRERCIEAGPALICCNHESFLDPPMVSIAFRKPIHFLARKTLFRNALFGGLIRRLNSIPVDQDRPDFTSLKRIVQLLKQGERVLIFPEGSRTLDGNLGPSEPGVGLLIAKSEAPVLPVRIFGAYDAFPRGSSKPKPGKITVVIGEPIDFTETIRQGGGKGKELYQQLADETMAAIAKLTLP